MARAEGHYRDETTLADERGMRPLVAHCRLGLGDLYAKIGKPLEARPELIAARDLYRAMEMIFWLPRVESALAAVAESIIVRFRARTSDDLRDNRSRWR